MHLASVLPLFVFMLSLVKADVEITLPNAGDSYSASGGTAQVLLAWDDDGDSDETNLDSVSSYTISLCTGPNDNIECFLKIVDNKKLSKPNVTAKIDADAGPEGWYYFQIYAVFSNGWTNHYSPRFKLTDMTGSGAVTITGVATKLVVTAQGDPPDPQLSATGSINSASFSLRYTEQTGKSKYAPMQSQPGSTVTATTWTMQYPTSAVTYYTSASPSPNAKTTITPGWSYTPTSLPNWASVAPYPTSYYPASERVTKASLSSAKKKRWFD